MAPRLGRKGRPSRLPRHVLQQKHCSVACQCWPSWLIWPWSTPICSPHESQYSANMASKQCRQYGRVSRMMYLWPPSCAWHSAHAKCLRCHARPSASVHSSARIIWKARKNRVEGTVHNEQEAVPPEGLHDNTHLVAGGAPRLERLGVVAAAVQPSVLEEVDEVDEQVAAGAAGEAGRVPRGLGTRPGRGHGHVAGPQRLGALQQKRGSTESDRASLLLARGGVAHREGWAILLAARAADITRRAKEM